MTAAQRPRLATAADLRSLNEDARYEVIGGAMVQKVAPSFEHGDAQSSIGELLKPPFQRGRGGPGGWWLASEVEVQLATHDVFLPDVAGWRKDRVPQRPKGRPILVRPDWVCEILSPSNALNDLGVKLAAYARAGVAHYWIVDPERELLLVHRLAGELYERVLEAGRNETVRAEPFDAIEMRVADLFGG